MTLSVSAIAWRRHEAPAVAASLAAIGIDRVDLAPSEYFPDPEAASDADVAAVRRWWSERGFAVAGLQGLTFGCPHLDLFRDERQAMRRRLVALCRIAAGLGAPVLVFGAAANRDPGALPGGEAMARAADFFARLGDDAARHGVFVTIEAITQASGCRFLTTTAQAATLVEAVAHPAIRLQLDTGAMIANGEPIAATVAAHAGLFGHVHASEPGLAPLRAAGVTHHACAAALAAHRPDLGVTIEMARDPLRSPVAAVAEAVAATRAAYGMAA